MIVVGIPFHDAKRYSIEPLLNWLRDASLPNTEILIRIHKGVYGEKDAVKTQREFFRQEAIRLNATHLFLVGCDTIPPLDTLQRLLDRNVDVVGGIYYGRHQATNGNPDSAVAWIHRNQDFNKKENLEKLSGLHEVDGMGMDCVLFSRRAFESFSFFDWSVNDDDYPAYNILKQKGFPIYLDCDITCKHYSNV